MRPCPGVCVIQHKLLFSITTLSPITFSARASHENRCHLRANRRRHMWCESSHLPLTSGSVSSGENKPRFVLSVIVLWSNPNVRYNRHLVLCYATGVLALWLVSPVQRVPGVFTIPHVEGQFLSRAFCPASKPG